jgi:hypothetical protein
MKYALATLFTIFLLAGTASGDIMPIGEASTAGFFQGNGTGETPRGWDFKVNSAGVMVTQLGVNAATSTSITLTLWNDSTQTELAQVVETSIADTWAFTALATPVALTLGNTYSVIGWANVTTTWYLLNSTPPPAFEPTGTIQYQDARFDNGIGANTFPGQTTPGQFGVTDIAYRLGPSSVPEPSAIVLLFTVGILILAAHRHRLHV